MQISKIVLKQIKSRKTKKDKATRYELSYTDGTKLIIPYFSTAVLGAGGVAIVPPAYCHPCRVAQAMVFYEHSHTTHCIVCNTELNTKDDRPIAKILEFKKHA